MPQVMMLGPTVPGANVPLQGAEGAASRTSPYPTALNVIVHQPCCAELVAAGSAHAGQGGFSTKIHPRAEGGGGPIALLITAGRRHEQSAFEALMETGAVKRAGRGRPRVRPDRVAGLKVFSGRKIRQYLRRRGIGIVIPRQKRERRRGRFDKVAFRKRNVVERLVNRLKQFRRVATRYEKRAVHYLGMFTTAAITLWL